MARLDNQSGSFALSAMAIAAGNFMTNAQKDRVLEVISMTEIGQMFVDKVERETKENLATGRNVK